MSDDLPAILDIVRQRTPARLLAGRTGAAYRTATQLELRSAHAAARDAVRAELNLNQDLGEDFLQSWGLFEVSSAASNKDEYLLRPDLGRQLPTVSRAAIVQRCATGATLQIVIGDGLSVTAVATQLPQLLPLLLEGTRQREWSTGQPFIIRHCRVGILNQIGELLRPEIIVLLIGERPGLATAESLSAYMAYRPKTGHTDANRNLISNIHARGVQPEDASRRILDFAAMMLKTQTSGIRMRESFAVSRELDAGEL
jgi:ethanolamine ammonia-lyase small subunit